MKNLATVLVLALLVISCNNKPEVEKPVEKSLEAGDYFFDFDEAIYYSGSDEITDAILDKTPTSRKDSISTMILTNDIPLSLKDEVAIAYLDSIGYVKMPVAPSKLASLKEIFRDNGLASMGDTSCLPMYRDFYVFKKQGKISGIAKICYDCEQSHIIGTNVSTEGFGVGGEFEQLNSLVKGK